MIRFSSRRLITGFVLCPSLLAVLGSACATSGEIEPIDPGEAGGRSSGSGGGGAGTSSSGSGSGGASPSNGGAPSLGGAPGSGGKNAGGAANGGALSSLGGKSGSSGGASSGGKSGSSGGKSGSSGDTGAGGVTVGSGGSIGAGGKAGGQGGKAAQGGGSARGGGTGDAGGPSSSGCDWTSAACMSKSCATACPTNDGGYCVGACGKIIACVQDLPPTCATAADPMCVKRGTSGAEKACTVIWENNSGGSGSPTAPGAIATALFECACDVMVP
jgi:hypothetical protein